MLRKFRLTTAEFRKELDNAARDDARWPYLCRHRWLLDHATSKDGEIILAVNCNDETVTPSRDLRR